MDSPDIIEKLFTPLCKETFFEDMTKKLLKLFLLHDIKKAQTKNIFLILSQKAFTFCTNFWLSGCFPMELELWYHLPLSKIAFLRKVRIFWILSKIFAPLQDNLYFLDKYEYFWLLCPNILLKIAKLLPLKDCLFFKGTFLTLLRFWIKYTVANRCCHN